MRKFDTGISCCISEKQYNNIMYGKQSPYIPFDLDYKRDIQMLCAQGMMEFCVNRENSFFTYRFAIRAVCMGMYPSLEVCLDLDKATAKTHEVSKLILKRMEQEKERLEALKGTFEEEGDDFGAFDFLQNCLDDKEEKIKLEKMLVDLDLCNHTYYLNDRVPKEMNPLIEKYVKTMYGVLEIDGKPTIIPNKNQRSIKELKLDQKGVSVRDGVVVLKDIYFDELLQTSILMEILEDKTSDICRGLFLDHCCFDIPHVGFGPLTDHSVLFKNCHFKQGFRWMGQPDYLVIAFDNCVISDELQISLPQSANVYINDCIFEKDSTLKLDWFGREHPEPHISITDSVFYGGFEVLKWDNLRLDMNNITFYKPFTIKDTKLARSTKISNLCFPTTTAPEMEDSKKELYDTLVSSNLKEMAEGLNLLANAKPKKPAFDYDAYQAAYESGWLKPEYAAYFLGKSINYLAKKRMDDKKKITRDSLPYKMDGRDIQYPVDALMSFKAKDWEKLKDLRKKYNYTGQASLGE